MSTTSDSSPYPPSGPASHAPPYGSSVGHERSLFGILFSGLARVIVFGISLAKLCILILIFVLLAGIFTTFTGGPNPEALKEAFYAGDRNARDKIAIIHIDGVLMEGLVGFAMKEIDAAAADPEVKAVVLRINSPGGTITASDDLHRRLNDLRKGKNRKHPGEPKPIVVSMSSLAASGGYYIAMIESDPPTLVFAEPSTVTGSIGVYAAFPNVKELADKHGVKMNYIKAGDIKASGSPFEAMSDHEREVWQGMVDHAYLRFLDVIAAARGPALTQATLQEDVTIQETVRVRRGPDKEKRVNYKRYRADGGIYTADQAKRLKLIDRVGDLSDAIEEARRLADLNTGFKAISYERPKTLLGALMGDQANKPPVLLDADHLADAAAPRLWYLAGQHEMAGFLAALGR